MKLDEAVGIAEEIPGWMEHDELRWLGERALEHRLIVEVGSWQGRSTKVMALMTKGVVYSVDDLTGEETDPDPNLDQHFRDNLAPEIKRGKVEVIRKASVEAAAGSSSIGMVFIDGDHEYPAPKNDIEAWQGALLEGGLLCGHDSHHPGVAASLEEALPDFARAAGSIWVAP